MPDGTLEPLRCGASNRCDWCALFAAIEAGLRLKLDAEMRMPTVGMTTTTRRPTFSVADMQKAAQNLWRQLRRELEPTGLKPRREIARDDPERLQLIEYCGFVEWTTGAGSRSGGVRRPHEHHLVKGIPADSPLLETFPLEDVPASHPLRANRQIEPGAVTTKLEVRASELWHRFTGDAFIVECRPLRTPAGAIAYLVMHHNKRPQAPPPGFRGRRLRPSKLYFEQDSEQLQILAHRLAAHKRALRVTKMAVESALYHESEREFELDHALTAALVEGLRSLANDPLELQLDLDRQVDHEAERRELVVRTLTALERIRSENPPELVRVRERLDLDTDTGEAFWRATAVLGPA